MPLHSVERLEDGSDPSFVDEPCTLFKSRVLPAVTRAMSRSSGCFGRRYQPSLFYGHRWFTHVDPRREQKRDRGLKAPFTVTGPQNGSGFQRGLLRLGRKGLDADGTPFESPLDHAD